MIGQRISQYLVHEKLGEGGMGVVWLAEDTVLGRRVALKMLKHSDAPEFRQFKGRFLREARLASTLNHPNIVQIYDYGETDEGLPYLVMELVRGRNLADVLREETLSIDEGLKLVNQVALALAEAHAHGIIHRDLKPSNVFINERGDAKVLDFGLAKLVSPDAGGASSSASSDQITETREGVFMGTPSYSSPEQLLGSKVDERSDIFSLGAVFYEILAGQPAFGGKNFAEICAQVIKDDPPPPSAQNDSAPRDYDAVALKALSKRAENRYQTIRELIRDLETAPAAEATGEMNPVVRQEPESVTATPTKSTGRSRIAISAAMIMIAAVAVGLAVTGTLRNPFTAPVSDSTPAGYEEGVAALRDGNYYKAMKLLDGAVAANENYPPAHARLAEALTELGYESRATAALVRVSELAPTYSSLSERDRLSIQAIAATVRRNTEGARQGFEKIVELAPENEKKFAIFDLARSFESADDADRAIEKYESAIGLDENFAAAHLRLAILHTRKQETEKAENHFSRAEQIYNQRSDYDGVGEVAYQRGFHLSMQEQLKPAAEKLARAAELAEMTGNSSLRVKALLHLSSVAYASEKPVEAQRIADSAVEIARREQLDGFAAIGLIETGNVFFIRGRFAEAEARFSQAFDRARSNDWPRIAARAGLALGSLYIQQTKAAEAIRFTEPALEFYRRAGFRREVLQAQLVLGYANDHLGNYEAALAAFRDHRDDANARGDKLGLVFANFYLGLVYLHQEKFADALGHYDESLALSRELGLESKIGYSQLNRGQSLSQLGRIDEARAALAEAERIATAPESGDAQLAAWTKLMQARSELADGEFDIALRDTDRAKNLAGPTAEIVVQAEITKCLALVRSGKTSKAVAVCATAESAASKTSMEHLAVKSRVALAEASLATGDSKSAEKIASEVLGGLRDGESIVSQWRCLRIMAKAADFSQNAVLAGELNARTKSVEDSIALIFGEENFAKWKSGLEVKLYDK